MGRASLRCGDVIVVLAIAFSLMGATASAQSASTGGIAGSVKDATGAVLPGVTVEASSPALIEKVRTVVSDGDGRYNIVDVPPGLYTVTFTLPGFASLKREGVQLTAGFTATVNAELRVGGLEESVTVTGASPVVDTHTVRTQNVLSREILDTLPSAKNIEAFAAVTLGATRVGVNPNGADVGGLNGEAQANLSIHGNRNGDQVVYVDGMNVGPPGSGSGFNRYYSVNSLMAQEMVVGTGGASAEQDTGGVQVNAVPKEGGNKFSGSFVTNGSRKGLQGKNIDSDLIARGLSPNLASLKTLYDVGATLGGPISVDRLWFFATHRKWNAELYQPNKYFNATPHTMFFTPDPDKPAYSSLPNRDTTIRLSWQATAKHKFTGMYSRQIDCYCFQTIEENRSPEATVHTRYNLNLSQASWSYPQTSRLLYQAAVTYFPHNRSTLDRPEGVSDTDTPISDLATAFYYGARGLDSTNALSLGPRNYSQIDALQSNGRFSASYVTGSHAAKLGMTWVFGTIDERDVANETPNGPVAFVLNNRLPSAVVYYAAPRQYTVTGRNLNFYAQDQWTVSRVTLNLGLRYDSVDAWVPAQTRPAGTFVPAYSFDEIRGLPSWKDVSPRLGGALDVFGNGKTAIKASLGRYVEPSITNFAASNSPALTIVEAAQRTWSDANGDYVPQSDELGPLSNSAFGTLRPGTTFTDELKTGRRPSNWQMSATVQHELIPRLALMAGYYRTWYENFRVTDNALVTQADYDPYCITAPVNAQLPGGGGNRICGLFDLQPAKFGLVQNVVKPASDFGKPSEIYNGIDVAVSARFGRGGQFSGGVSTGRTVTNNCVIVDSPDQRFCEVTLPSEGQIQTKWSGSYPLPWGLAVSAVFQNLPGFPIQASYVATNAEIAPSLGRNLASCGTRVPCTGTVTLNLMEPNTVFGPRLTQTDFRLTKKLTLGRVRAQAQVDAYNAFNANVVTLVNTRYGPAWLRPQQIMAARLLKLGMQIDF